MYKQLAAIGMLLGLPIVLFSVPEGTEASLHTVEALPLSAEDTETVSTLLSDLTSEGSEAQLGTPQVSVLTSSTTLIQGQDPAPTSVTPPVTDPTATTQPPATQISTTIASPSTESTTSTTAQTTSPPTAEPATTNPTTSSPPTSVASTIETRGNVALASISYNWQATLPGWTIEFSPGREGVIGYTYTYEKRIEIFVRDGMSDGLLRHVIAHEVGHAVDVTLNSSSDREQWQASRDVGSSPWWPGNGVSDYSTGAGDFAECFAVWQVGPSIFRSKVAGLPTSDQLGLLSSLAAG